MNKNQQRPIDQRFECEGIPTPNVSMLDLMYALNYIAVEDTSVDFVYNHYTSSRLFYERGSRPKLEAVADRVTEGIEDEFEKVQALVDFIAENVLWAGVEAKRTGILTRAEKYLTEEQLIERGFCWCHEQARVFCCLTQIAGITSRLIFAGSGNKWGHVTSEVLLSKGWMLVDQSFGVCFVKDGMPVRAVDVFGDESNREYFAPILLDKVIKCRENIHPITMEGMLIAENPIECFRHISVCNHFVI